MLIKEMQKLKFGDVLLDVEMSDRINDDVYCFVVKLYDDFVTCIAMKESHQNFYPHNFRFNSKDSKKIIKTDKKIDILNHVKCFEDIKKCQK